PQIAQSMAEKTVRHMLHASPNAAYMLEGYAGVTEVYLGLWESEVNLAAAERDRLAQSARQVVKVLHRFARTFPIGRPRAWLWQGTFAWLAGQPTRAHQAWHSSLTGAQQMAMP